MADVSIPLNCNDSVVADLSRRLKCTVPSFSIRYLGIPLGANPRSEATWDPIIDKIKKRLSAWKSKLLSRAAILTLIKFVLINFPYSITACSKC